MALELIPKQAQGAQDWRARHIDQGAIALASVEIEDFLKLVEQDRIAFSLVNSLEHCGKHRGLHSAGRTLSTRFLREELRDA
jgi:hypothetical protein